MSIRKHDKNAQCKVRLSGSETLKDVVLRVFNDVRLLPLLVDLNPGILPLKAPISGTVVVVPGKAEAQQFASRMGFSLGFDPAKGGGTEQKRAWNQMKIGRLKQSSAIEPVQLAALFAEQGLAPDVAARRARILLSEEAIKTFTSASHETAASLALVNALTRESELATVAKWLGLLSNVFANVASAKGRLALTEAALHRPEQLKEILSSALVVPKLQEDLIARAATVPDILKSVRKLAVLDEFQREGAVATLDESEKLSLLSLAAAEDKGLPLLEGERLEFLGIARQFRALESHFSQLATTFRRVLERVERAPKNVLNAVLLGDESINVPRPWPVVVKMASILGPKVQQQHAGTLELGLIALLPRLENSEEIAVLNAGELAAKAVHNAMVADAFDAVPERLAPSIVALLPALRPLGPDYGPEAQVRLRRKSHFEKSCLAPRETAANPQAVAQLFEQLLKNSDCLDVNIQKRLKSLRNVRAPLQKLAERVCEPIPVLAQSASDLGRTLLFAAIALDVEWGRGLARSEGLELAERICMQHGTRALTLATQYFTRNVLLSGSDSICA